MDRNSDKDADWVRVYVSLSARRAWIEITAQTARNTSIASLSARRAWIEIDIPANLDADRAVALRKESVDRNLLSLLLLLISFLSLSARRAWIEIKLAKTSRTENEGRSPQGERG